MTKKEQALFTHKDYMDKKCSHREYFAQFVTNGTLNAVSRSIGKDRIVASTDPHFNDIPLRKWDALTGYGNRNIYGTISGGFHATLPCNYNRIKEAGEWATAATLVCIAKEAARQLKEEWL